jgi:O-antigen/teichoic acid export membrane protein
VAAVSGLIRILVCLGLFGVGAQALGGGTVGVFVSGAVALAVNHLWRQQQHAEYRQSVIEDEDLRLEVRERRSKP